MRSLILNLLAADDDGAHFGFDPLRAAGATVIFDDSILPDSFAVTVARVATFPYVREGTEKFLAEYGPTTLLSGKVTA